MSAKGPSSKERTDAGSKGKAYGRGKRKAAVDPAFEAATGEADANMHNSPEDETEIVFDKEADYGGDNFQEDNDLEFDKGVDDVAKDNPDYVPWTEKEGEAATHHEGDSAREEEEKEGEPEPGSVSNPNV